ncbi:MAG: hypothetical protein NVSMB62_14130 [Acidobacteriaceae bacterium]
MLVIESCTGKCIEPIAAVMVYQSMIFGFGTRIYAADFHGAARTVVAPRNLRSKAALVAAEALLKQGALIAQISYEGEEAQAAVSAIAGPQRRWASRARQMSCYLPVGADLDATLAQVGKRTRRNLRHYQRLAATDLGAELVVCPSLSKEEFLTFNEFSDYSVSNEEAFTRFNALQRYPLPLFLGLKDGNGEWLAFLGGHRRGADIFLEWQMNRKDLARYSLSTTMRAHLMDFAVRLGSRRLYFVRGTSSSIVNSTIPEKLVDFVVTRPGVPNWLISKVAANGDDLPPYQGEIPALFRSPGWNGDAHFTPEDGILTLPDRAA